MSTLVIRQLYWEQCEAEVAAIKDLVSKKHTHIMIPPNYNHIIFLNNDLSKTKLV
jgi:hypothetical protein